jgi:hypothetical protein
MKKKARDLVPGDVIAVSEKHPHTAFAFGSGWKAEVLEIHETIDVVFIGHEVLSMRPDDQVEVVEP